MQQMPIMVLYILENHKQGNKNGCINWINNNYFNDMDFIKFLKFVFIQAKSFFGWIGTYLVAAVPAAGAYMITISLFGVGIAEASLTGFITAAIIGTVMSGV